MTVDNSTCEFQFRDNEFQVISSNVIQVQIHCVFRKFDSEFPLPSRSNLALFSRIEP